MNTGIYAIRNIRNGKVYVGRSVDLHRRKERHFSMLRRNEHHSIKLQNAFNRDGESAFVAETMLLCAPEHLELYEQILIDGMDAVENGYNICPLSCYGMAGRNHTEETKKKMSQAAMGRKKSAETREKMSKFQCNRAQLSLAKRNADKEIKRIAANLERERRPKYVHPEATRAKMAEAWTPERIAAQSERVSAMWTPGKKAEFAAKQIGNKYGLGYTHSDEVREKMSAGWTPERKAALVVRLSKPCSEETKARLKVAWTPERRAEAAKHGANHGKGKKPTE